MKTLYFKASLSCGDMIYSLLTVKALCKALDCKAVYYIKQTPHNPTFDTLEACRRLFLEQPYIESCERFAGQNINIDFDKWRGFYSYDTPIPLQLAATAQRQIHTKFAVNILDNWLTVYSENYKQVYTVIANTTRYQKFSFSFHKQILSTKNECLFLGNESEYERYKAHSNIERYDSGCLLTAAYVIQGCKEIYCNQSAVLTIAQGLGKTPLYLAKDRAFNSTVLGKETIL